MWSARFLCVILSSAAADAQSQVLDFELGAPCSIAQASAASNVYAHFGVTFVGPAPGAGAVVLDECAAIGIDAYDGSGFLVVAPGQSSSTGPVDGPVTIDFDPPIARFNAKANSAIGHGTYDIEGYLGGQLVASSFVGSAGWVKLRMGSQFGLDRIVIRSRDPSGVFVLDDIHLVRCPGDGIGRTYCAPPYNQAWSSPSCLSAYGTNIGGGPYTALDFRVDGGPPGAFGLVLASRTSATLFWPGAVPYNGAFCLHDYAAPADIARFPNLLQFDAAGTAWATIDLTSVPTAVASAVLPGETWYFQAWHRDRTDVYTLGTSFSDGLEIRFEP